MKKCSLLVLIKVITLVIINDESSHFKMGLFCKIFLCHGNATGEKFAFPALLEEFRSYILEQFIPEVGLMNKENGWISYAVKYI